MKIGIDMMGGDFAPDEIISGIKSYLEEDKAHLVLLGDEKKLAPLLLQHLAADNYTLVHTPQTIDMHDHPARALKDKPRSSIAVGFHLLATGETDAFISAGNTGAMLVGSLYALKPIEGVLRPTISTVVPKENGSSGLLLDVGLNSDCKPEQLNQFAIMGSVYAQQILGIEKPRVALLN
ncbi:MAG: phosphate--acyl-ACP acyltransferase, partial [Flavisolibacter sp.]|nr:phosphate--acyl-ACP acyltransferase [Flavisolibacter sp.]